MALTLSWDTGARSGFQALEATFLKLAQLRPEMLSAAIQPAAELVLGTAQDLVPKRADERLLRSLFCAEESADEAGVSWIIGCEKAIAFYATMVEFGTGPHEQGDKGHVHPGAAAHPFLRPAMDQNQDAILRIIGEGVAADIDAVAGANV